MHAILQTQFLGIYQKTCTRMVIVALSMTAPNGRWHKGLLNKEPINALWDFPTMGITQQQKRMNYFYL